MRHFFHRQLIFVSPPPVLQILTDAIKLGQNAFFYFKNLAVTEQLKKTCLVKLTEKSKWNIQTKIVEETAGN